MPVDDSNQAQADSWTASGTMWTAMRDRFDAQAGAHGVAAIDALAPTAGEYVIDVGCGAGTTTLQLAERVGDTGERVDTGGQFATVMNAETIQPGEKQAPEPGRQPLAAAEVNDVDLAARGQAIRGVVQRLAPVTGVCGHPRFGRVSIEPLNIETRSPRVEAIPGGVRDDHALAELFPQGCDVGLDRRARRGWRLTGPEAIDEDLGRNRPPVVQSEDREQAPMGRPHQRPPVLTADTDRPQHPEEHPSIGGGPALIHS